MIKPVAFPRLEGGEAVEITATHGTHHAFSTRNGSRFYVLWADARTPAESKRMGVDFWGGMSAVDTLSRASALSIYHNRLAVSTIGGRLTVGRIDRPVAATIEIGNTPRGCLCFVGSNLIAVATCGDSDGIHLASFDDHEAFLNLEHSEPLVSVPSSMAASSDRVVVGDVSRSVAVYSVISGRGSVDATNRSLQLTHMIPCCLSAMSISGNLLLVRDDSESAQVRVLRLKKDSVQQEAMISCNNATSGSDRIACIEAYDGDPVLVVYNAAQEGNIVRQHPQRLLDVNEGSGSEALGFVVGLEGRSAHVTSRCAPQMWVSSYINMFV